jgi:hypothetical protein
VLGGGGGGEAAACRLGGVGPVVHKWHLDITLRDIGICRTWPGGSGLAGEMEKGALLRSPWLGVTVRWSQQRLSAWDAQMVLDRN